MASSTIELLGIRIGIRLDDAREFTLVTSEESIDDQPIVEYLSHDTGFGAEWMNATADADDAPSAELRQELVELHGRVLERTREAVAAILDDERVRLA